jgi:hypothetical protein
MPARLSRVDARGFGYVNLKQLLHRAQVHGGMLEVFSVCLNGVQPPEEFCSSHGVLKRIQNQTASSA